MLPFRFPPLRAAGACLLTLALLAPAGLLVHEMGHGLTALALGGRFTALYVWPGRELWPHPGQPYRGAWQGQAGAALYIPGADWQPGGWRFGVTALMGSGANVLLAALAQILLGCLHPRRGWARRLLLGASWLFLDLTLYTFLPLLGLRHFLFLGGAAPEPLEGAAQAGVPAGIFLLLAGSVSIWMARGARRHCVHGIGG